MKKDEQTASWSGQINFFCNTFPRISQPAGCWSEAVEDRMRSKDLNLVYPSCARANQGSLMVPIPVPIHDLTVGADSEDFLFSVFF